MARRASGLERVTRELFSSEALAPLSVDGAEASGGRLAMMMQQSVHHPWTAMVDRGPVWVFPGYPPTPLFTLWRDRTVLYVHDMFLITRPQDLNWPARLYMAPSFRLAIGRLRYFLVNSLYTGSQLRTRTLPDAVIIPYRPRASNVFGLAAGRDMAGPDDAAPLIVGTVGTVEPRKNLLAAADICAELATCLQRPVELHIVGRRGWGREWEQLSAMAHVRLHGFLNDADARRVIEAFDLYLCTSHDEGLGLPLLEAQFAGLPIIAPDEPVFREVLSGSGTYIASNRAGQSARAIADLMQRPDWRSSFAQAAAENIARWNSLADEDRTKVIALLGSLASARTASPTA